MNIIKYIKAKSLTLLSPLVTLSDQCTLGRIEDASKAANAAVTWSPDDPVTLAKALPHLDKAKAQRKSYRRRVERYTRAARVMQMAARRYILWPKRGAKIVRKTRAVVRIQTAWRCWDVWNRMAGARLRAKSRRLGPLWKFAKGYRHARPAIRAEGMM